MLVNRWTLQKSDGTILVGAGKNGGASWVDFSRFPVAASLAGAGALAQTSES
jgi:hypothetical protein